MKSIKKQKIIISVTNDLVTDKRVHETAVSLIKFGYEVLLVGRKLKNSLPVNRDYKTKRFNLPFNKGFLFYACYNIRLFLFLIFAKADIFLANDLDTLPANFLASKIRKKKLVYDSHEYFTEVPELVNRPRVKRIWEKIEEFILPKIKHSYTVCNSIADIYNKKYGIDMKVVRNIPVCEFVKKQTVLSLPEEIKNRKIILYQGAVNIGRGIEPTIKAMQYVENAVFLIIGNGDIFRDIKKLVQNLNLTNKVFFTGKIPFADLYAYTKKADIGISLEENIGLNYYYALPNKLFDYIRANLPVLASPLPEIKNIVETYDIGCFIENHKPEHIAEKINFMLTSPEKMQTWKENLKKASAELCRENEEKILKDILLNL
ncbi:MAG: glycosyltransferase family 4 protein [Chlorobi bacterium]|nr:glycosyltransferase family 4 protein [Chlorobiota bacterium]